MDGLGSLNCLVRGNGKLALSTPGGLYRVHLEAERQYHVHASHLVAWNTKLHPQLLANDTDLTVPEVASNSSNSVATWFPTNWNLPISAIPTPKIPDIQAWYAETFTKQRFREFLNRGWEKSKSTASRIGNYSMIKLSDRLNKGPPMVSLRGPGTFYIASRTPTRFDWLHRFVLTRLQFVLIYLCLRTFHGSWPVEINQSCLSRLSRSWIAPLEKGDLNQVLPTQSEVAKKL
jgi:hypothetical protein